MARISILGAGRMGTALAKAFLTAGHPVTVWNRSPKLTAVGARVASSVLDATDADLVIDVVSDYDASASLVRTAEVSAALSGKTLLELASGTPREARSAAAWATEHRIRYLDGAIMATPDFIGQPGCTILFSGPKDVFEAHASTFRAIADNSAYVGEAIAHANVLDNAILAVLWGATHGLLQGAAVCEAESFPLEAFGQTLKGAWPVVEPLLLAALERIRERRWSADATTQSTLAPGYVTVRHLLAMSREYGIDTALPEALHSVFQRAVDKGHGQDDIASAFEGMR